MLTKSNLVFIVHRDCNSPALCCRKSGGFSSLVTLDCVFTREEAWAYVNKKPCNTRKYETYVFKTLDENCSFLGKTPQEIADCKKAILSEWCKTHKKENKEQRKNEKKTKKKSSAQIEEGLFSDLGENREFSKPENAIEFDFS